MRTVENPKKLFRKIDATSLDEDDESYDFNVGEAAMDNFDREELNIRNEEVEFEDLSDPATDFHASLEAVEEAATEVDDSSNVPDDVDTKFHTQEDGRTVTYMADTDRMGYEVIKSESDPRLAGYVVIFPDTLVKVKT